MGKGIHLIQLRFQHSQFFKFCSHSQEIVLHYLFIWIQQAALHFRRKLKILIDIPGKLIKTWEFQIKKKKAKWSLSASWMPPMIFKLHFI